MCVDILFMGLGITFEEGKKMIKISLNKICFDEWEKSKIYGSLRRLLPFISDINKEISALNRVCDTKIKLQIKICNNFIVEVEDAQN